MQHIIIRREQAPILNHSQWDAREKYYSIRNRPQKFPPRYRKTAANAATAIEEGKVEY